MAEALASGQSEELLEVAHFASNTRDIRELHETVNNEMIQNIKQIYDLYMKQTCLSLSKFDFFHSYHAHEVTKRSLMSSNAHAMQLKQLIECMMNSNIC